MKPPCLTPYLALCLHFATSQAQSPQQLIDSLLHPPPGSKHYSSYSSEIYFNHTLYNQTPIAPTTYDRLEASAKALLRPEAYDYAAGGAGLETTVAANRAAFDRVSPPSPPPPNPTANNVTPQWQILPRVLRPVQPSRNLSTTLFSRTYPAPLVMAPIGVQTLFHPSGERATASIWGESRLPFTLSTASSTGFAAAAAANGADNPRWYQLYWPSYDDLTRSYLRSAKAHGFDVLVVTVDTWDLGWRGRDLDRGFFPFIEGQGVQIGLEDEVAHEKLGFDASRGNASAEERTMAALYHTITTSRGVSPVWGRLGWLREVWVSCLVHCGWKVED